MLLKFKPENHLESLLKHKLSGPYTKDSDSIWGGSWEFAFLTGFPVMLQNYI